MDSKLRRRLYLFSVPVLIALILVAIVKPGKSFRFQNSNSKVDHKIFTALLSKNVNEKGLVDYEGFKTEEHLLNQYLASLGQNPPDSKTWSREEQLAYWINAYNAFTIKLILDHYPLGSIKDIGSAIQIPLVNSPWDISFIKIGEQKLTLNDIEHRILRKDFNEPRIHFAIVCASISCPDLRREAYQASKLDQQLQEQAVYFINNPAKNEITPENISVSKIFQWFGGDFTEKSSLIDFLNGFSKVKISKDARIRYSDYNWGLNNQKNIRSENSVSH